MPPKVALAVFGAFIAWLIIRDVKQRRDVSHAIWIPIFWLVIIGSRPITSWFGFDAGINNADDYLEGSPFDRLFFLSLIVMGAGVLAGRTGRLAELLRDNRWVTIYFLYLGISCLWSDYGFTSFKRWIKD